MHQEIVITLVGPDRPGLVDEVSSVVVAHGGNWLESRMCNLGGQFAGVVRISVPSERVDQLLATLKSATTGRLEIVAKNSEPTLEAATNTVQLDILGNDRPGIIAQISRVLAAHHVNVEELHTSRESAAMSGDLLFRACAKLALPDSLDTPALRADLERIASDFMVDIDWED